MDFEINDLCKYVTWNMGIECAIVATAPSMDGYASSGAAMITKGMKVTYTTHPPKYIVADIDYIKHAPMNMIQSGYGDIIGKYSCLNDWCLGRAVNGEELCEYIYDLTYSTTASVAEITVTVFRPASRSPVTISYGLIFSTVSPKKSILTGLSPFTG